MAPRWRHATFWRVAPHYAVRFYRAVPYRHAVRTWRPAVYAYAQRRYTAPLRVARSWRRPVAAMASLRAPASAAPASSGVIAQAMRFVGAGNVTGMRGPWCADYASMVLRMSGHRPLANRSVSSAFAYGPRVRQPRPGDLVVVNTRNGYAQHVGFFAGYDHGQVVMVSGNWGHRVSRSPISPGSVAAYIRI